MSMKKHDTIFLAGHAGMVGSAIFRLLVKQGYKNILTKSSRELDLTNQQAVLAFFDQNKIDVVILAAAKVGGIYANNKYPADFIYENIMIEANVIHNAFKNKVSHLLFLGSSCIYPKNAPQPIDESSLLTSILEPTNEPYAIAKIAGIKLCESYNRQHNTDFRSVMPTNLYGPHDNFNLMNSHVAPALMKKFYLAHLVETGNISKVNNIDREEAFPDDVVDMLGLIRGAEGLTFVKPPCVKIWGSGVAKREFLHVDDMATACLHVLNISIEDYQEHTEEMLSHLNVGCGEDVSIYELALMIKEISGFEGEVVWDKDKPDGTLRKLMDSSKLMALGWKPTYTLQKGLVDAFDWFVSNKT